MIRTILFVGKPGSGKETQAKPLAEKTGYRILSTGAVFRELRVEESPLGERVKEVYDQGKLLPAWLASYLFQPEILRMHAAEGIILEGTGRARAEAELFDEVTGWLGRKYVVVNLDISDAEAITRQVGRGRSDSDTEEKVRTRLSEYENATASAISFFEERGVLINVSGERSVADIHADIVERLKR